LIYDGFSLKPKRVATNKTDTNSAVVDGLYFPRTGRALPVVGAGE